MTDFLNNLFRSENYIIQKERDSFILANFVGLELLKQKSNSYFEFKGICVYTGRSKKIIMSIIKNKYSPKMLEQILNKMDKFLSLFCCEVNDGPLSVYEDYLISYSKDNIKLEITLNNDLTSLSQLDCLEKCIFFFDIRTHLFDLLTSLCYLKKYGIPNPSSLNLQNILFDYQNNYLKLNNFISIETIFYLIECSLPGFSFTFLSQ